MPIAYFKKTNYLGSLSGMRFCMGKYQENEESETQLRVTIWPGPFSMDNTDPEKMFAKDFSFNAEGISDAIDYVNATYENARDKWDDIPFWSPEMVQEYNKKYEERIRALAAEREAAEESSEKK